MTEAPTELAMVRTAEGTPVPRPGLPKIENIQRMLRYKRSMGLPAELTHSEVRDLHGTLARLNGTPTQEQIDADEQHRLRIVRANKAKPLPPTDDQRRLRLAQQAREAGL